MSNPAPGKPEGIGIPYDVEMGVPVTKKIHNIEHNLGKLFILYYVQGRNVHHQSENFFHDGDLRSAIKRSQEYCTNTGKRWLRTSPFLTDLDIQERRITDGGV